MRQIFDEETKLQHMLKVEAALAWAHSEVGNIPQKDAERIMEAASTKVVKLDRVKEIEREIKHDVMAMVKALAEACGSSGAYVHLGATSSDILDTATAIQFKDALTLIRRKLNDLEEVMIEGAERYKKTMMIGRTHGQHALPTTLGFRFAVWTREIARHLQRLKECSGRLLVGKMSGAVGTQAGLGKRAFKIQELVMKKLGIKPSMISTQIVQRDRWAESVCLFAIIASTLDNIAREIRELQRPEIGEAFEPFDMHVQVGSSTMPHKRNPIVCERISGLAKILRSLAIPALENITTWHERDITQSSSERFIIPETFILTDYILFLITKVLKGLKVDEQRMLKNLKLTEGRIMSESVMLALTRKGMGRQEAHELIRGLALESNIEKRPLKSLLKENTVIQNLMSVKEISKALNPREYLGTAIKQVEFVIEKTRAEKKVRERI